MVTDNEFYIKPFYKFRSHSQKAWGLRENVRLHMTSLIQ